MFSTILYCDTNMYEIKLLTLLLYIFDDCQRSIRIVIIPVYSDRTVKVIIV